MKTLIIITAMFLSTAAYAQVSQCQVMSDGQIFCTPAGGQGSIYGR